MYYFDNKYLGQYVDSKEPVKVYVDSDWYDVTDQADLKDPIHGIGYTEYGEPHYFDYRDVTSVKVGSRLITQDMLQSQKTGKPDEEDEPKGKPGGDDDSGLEPAEAGDEPGGEKEPELSWYNPSLYDVGRGILKEVNKRRSSVIPKKRKIE